MADTAPAPYELSITAGDDESWVFKFYQDTEKTIPLDLTGRTYAAQVRIKPGDTSATPAATLSTAVVTNTVTVSATATQTRALRDAGRRYYWDLEETVSGKKATLFKGGVTIFDDVTR